jgi:type VI secretion system secreted protein Hcp
MKIVKNAVVLSLVVGAAAVAVDASAALNAYVKFTGQKQGPFKGGGITIKGHTDQSIVFGIDLDTQVPADLSTGLATGKRQHSPLILVKPIDAATPQIFQALVTNEVLKTVEVDLSQTNVVGQNANFFTYKLTNAQIIDVHHSLTTPCVGSAPCRATGPDGNIVGPDEPTETVALTFQKIEITYVNGGVTASDDWQSPVD